MEPCFGSCATNSMTGPPRTHPTDTVSLKKMARGFVGLIRGAWKLVFEKTRTCESIDTPSAESTDVR